MTKDSYCHFETRVLSEFHNSSDSVSDNFYSKKVAITYRRKVEKYKRNSVLMSKMHVCYAACRQLSSRDRAAPQHMVIVVVSKKRLEAWRKALVRRRASSSVHGKAGIGAGREGPLLSLSCQGKRGCEQEPPHNFCLEGVAVENFHARNRQYSNAYQLCLLFPVPGHNAVFSRDGTFGALPGWF